MFIRYMNKHIFREKDFEDVTKKGCRNHSAQMCLPGLVELGKFTVCLQAPYEPSTVEICDA